MPLTLPPLLQRFADRQPLPVMAQSLLRHSFRPEILNALFAGFSERQYSRKLLFSTLFDLMTAVVFRQQPSICAGYQPAGREVIGASLAAVYDKLNGLEPGVLQQLADYSVQTSQELIDEMAVPVRPWLPGVEVRILDGNALGGRQHRLQETRASSAAPLPGKALVVLDPARQLIVQLHPCEDAYTQERALLPAVLASVQPGELWVADRNFCTTELLITLDQRQAYSLIREHGLLRFTPVTAEGAAQPMEGGEVREQWVRVTDATGQSVLLRRINVYLDHPTRDGETVLHLLTTVPEAWASAAELAHYYRQRWRIETAFYRMTVELRCEIDTLAYPGAALFGFTVAVVVFNALSVLMGALRAVHGQEVIDEQFSTYYLANDLRNASTGLHEMLDEPDWACFLTVSSAVMAEWLLQTAAKVNLKKYQKAKPRKKATAGGAAQVKRNDKGQPHVSTARLLAQRKVVKKSP